MVKANDSKSAKKRMTTRSQRQNVSRNLRRSETTGLNVDQLKRLSVSIREDVESELYDGASVIVARDGKVALREAIGFADRTSNRLLHIDDVFHILSVTKAFTDVLVLSLIERGKLALTTRVTEIIPEFNGGVKDGVTVFHLMTHTAGSPQVLFPVEADQMGNLDAVIKEICKLDPVSAPGSKVSYSPLWGHALLGEIIRRLDEDKRPLRGIFQEDLFGRLKMESTALGRRRDLSSRIVPIVARDPAFGQVGQMTIEEVENHNRFITEGAEIPWMGCISSAEDLFRFAEMLRCEGELDGVRLLSPATVRLATSIQTGTLINEYHAPVIKQHGLQPGPANIGLDLLIRGRGISLNTMGNLTSPSTYGKFGLGGTGFWVDPERGVTFVFLRSGLLEHYHDTVNYQRISDMAIAAAI
jgi:CubicO group peptidase (beta-lactamase class C family)